MDNRILRLYTINLAMNPGQWPGPYDRLKLCNMAIQFKSVTYLQFTKQKLAKNASHWKSFRNFLSKTLSIVLIAI